MPTASELRATMVNKLRGLSDQDLDRLYRLNKIELARHPNGREYRVVDDAIYAELQRRKP